MQWSAMEWIDGMQCSGVEWNGCILVIFGHFGNFGSKFGSFFVKKRKQMNFSTRRRQRHLTSLKKKCVSELFIFAGPKMARPIFAGPKMPRPIFARQKRPPEPDNVRNVFFCFFSNVVLRADSDFGHDSPSRGKKMPKIDNLKTSDFCHFESF